MHYKPIWYALSGVGALIMAAASVNPGDAASNLAGWAEVLGLTNAAQWLADNVSDFWVAVAAAGLFGFSVATWLPIKIGTEAKQPTGGTAIVQDIADAWWSVSDVQPANTFIILSAGIERSRLQGNHPAWEVFLRPIMEAWERFGWFPPEGLSWLADRNTQGQRN